MWKNYVALKLLLAAILAVGLAAATQIQADPPADSSNEKVQKVKAGQPTGKEKGRENAASPDQQGKKAATGQAEFEHASEEMKNGKYPVDFLEREAKKASPARSNGVELALKVKTVQTADGTNLAITWTLKYDGPRPPLNILRPSIERNNTATTISAYAVGNNFGYGRMQIFAFGDPTRFPTKESFITIPAGKSASGTITFPVMMIKKRFLEAYPTEFDARTPAKLFVTISHHPLDRGEHFALDAWTGNLDAGIVSVPALKKW